MTRVNAAPFQRSPGLVCSRAVPAASTRADSQVRVFTASSPFDLARFEKGLPFLQARYDVSLAEGLFERTGFLAGSDEARARAIHDALQDPSIAALIAARGGHGATRLLPSLRVETVRAANKQLVGFSDVTALHALWARAGLCSIHGPMVCSLADASADVQAQLFTLLEGAQPSPLTNLAVWCEGETEGRLFGGNLAVLAALLGTPYLPDLTGTILLLEDIGERPYRVDRMLTSMLQAGFFEGVRGVVLGQFSDCLPGSDGTSVEDVLREHLSGLGVPVFANAPVGHVADNVPMLLGSWAEMAGGSVSFGG
jgi:muramoyltetrapeptide carboxypeptidase